jgi:hypothetical protein
MYIEADVEKEKLPHISKVVVDYAINITVASIKLYIKTMSILIKILRS